VIFKEALEHLEQGSIIKYNNSYYIIEGKFIVEYYKSMNTIHRVEATFKSEHISSNDWKVLTNNEENLFRREFFIKG